MEGVLGIYEMFKYCYSLEDIMLKIFPPFVGNVLVRRKRKKREEWKEKGKRHGHNSLLYPTSWVLLTLMSVHVFKHVEINRSGSHDLCEHHVHICIHKSIHRKSAKPKCRTNQHLLQVFK